jgi:hypothetical protein
MASVSYNLAAGVLEGHELEPDEVSKGTSAPGAGDIELRVDMTKVSNINQIIRALEVFKRRAEDGRYGPNDFGII